MSTTICTSVQGIGLGIMGQFIARHVPEITKIIGVRRSPGSGAEDLEFPDRPMLVYDIEIPPEALSYLYNDKYLYIESSYGLSPYMAAGQRLYVPMWEQGSTSAECVFQPHTIAVTRHTEDVMRQLGARRVTYLPWPVGVPESARVVHAVRTIVHNAGSLGGNLRKGTHAAIRIFQKSGVAARGVRLVVHSWLAPPPEIAAIIAEAPDNIEWTGRFAPSVADIYEGGDLLLMPSKIEGHALCALEAMASGMVVLATDSAPINEYEDDRAFLLPVSACAPSPLAAPYSLVDEAAGADCLRALCERDVSERSKSGREQVVREYSWAAVGDRWRELCA